MINEEKNVEAEKVKKLAEFKKRLEDKIKEAENDLDNLKTLLEFVDKAILESGFRRAKLPKLTPEASQAATATTSEKYSIALKAASGEPLADLHVNQDSMQVTIPETRTFNKNTPPFQQFLIERVLEKMCEKDVEAADRGKLPHNNIFSYKLVLNGDIIREITIKHVTPDRVRELQSSIRWTLEKMHEKTKGV